MGNIDKDRIVCRCKKVSEGTVIEAIKNGADTYEKVFGIILTICRIRHILIIKRKEHSNVRDHFI